MTFLEKIQEALYQRLVLPNRRPFQPRSEEEALQLARTEIERHGLEWEQEIGVSVSQHGNKRYWDITTRGGDGPFVHIIERDNGHTVVRFADRCPPCPKT